MNGGSNGSNVNSVKSLWCGVISNSDGMYGDLLLFVSSPPLHCKTFPTRVQHVSFHDHIFADASHRSHDFNPMV